MTTKPKKSLGELKAEQQEQIKARVAPERKPNVVKKGYAMGSPGHDRRRLDITLTQIKKYIDMRVPRVVTDSEGEETVELVRDTAVCTAERRNYVSRGLLGAPSKTAKQRRRNNRVSAVGTKGTKPPKKSWHKSKKAA
jgi:hypothetical protein